MAYARSHFITWAAQVGTPAASQLTDLLRISSFPYLAVLAASPSTSAAASTSTTIHRRPQTLRMLASIDGAASAEAVLRALEGAVSAASASNRGATRRATAAAEARSVREEQDAALAASMAEDRRRAEAERRRVEAARQAEEDAQRAEQEAKQRREQAIEDRHNAVIARRTEKRAALPAEAEPGGEGCALIRVKLPQGASTQRRFPSGATVGDMYDWVDSLDEIEAHSYVLTSTFPRQEHPRADAGALLCNVGLVPNAALMVIVEDE